MYPNFPVNLYAKFYSMPLISEAMKCPKIVRCMSDDLKAEYYTIMQKIIIVSEIVYYYRVGGITSKYMPYMLEDFLALYQYKEKMAACYPIPFDMARLMNIELINIARSYLLMCVNAGKYSVSELNEEIQKIIKIPIIRSAAENVDNIDMAEHIRKEQYDLIAESIWRIVKKDKRKID